MLQRFNHFSLIIDPSGQAAEFIMNAFQHETITKISFLDDSFRKNLESAFRFGNPLVVQDVERYDPILNPVLNREVRRTDGRTLITTAFANFTVTRVSLQSRCLSHVIKVERPDIDEKRRDLLESLNNVKGRILDDDTIIIHLETLKHEAFDITKKVEEIDSVMKEIKNVSKQYSTLFVAFS